MATELKLRHVRHLTIRNERLRALLHEAWKNGNESYNVHHESDGEVERRRYITKVMLDNEFSFMKETTPDEQHQRAVES